MKVHVIGQTWEASVTGGWFSATDYTIPPDVDIHNSIAVTAWVRQNSGDFAQVRDFSVPGIYPWWFQDSQDIYDSCMYPEMEAEA